MSPISIIIPLLTFAIGAIALWANPGRRVNQVFSLASLTATLWLFFVSSAVLAGDPTADFFSKNPVPWLRAASAVGGFFPWIIWLLNESIGNPDRSSSATFKGSLVWLLMAFTLAALCYSETFILPDNFPGGARRGTAYTLYLASSAGLYSVLLFQTYRKLKDLAGIRRIEMQFITFNAGVACLLAILVNSAGYYFELRSLSRLSPLIILGFYVLTAWGVTVHRIFDARQVFLSMVQRLFLVAILCCGVFVGQWLFGHILLPPIDLIVSIAICSSLAFLLERKTREWFQLSPEQNIAALRRTMNESARSEPNPDKLISSFESLLRSWGHANYARLLFDSGEVYAAGDLEFAKDRPAHGALCRMGWTTPESLQRQRAEAGLVDLRHFLNEFDLGLVVTAPRGSTTPSLLLALGTKVNKRPFTYPEVLQVQEIAEFMDNILARSRLTIQARQSEQLATIGLLGASLAHEIRNPLVSIKTFAHLLPSRFEDPEFRRRFNVLIPTEVDRIESLTQQLLDLSNPRRHQMERMSLHAVARETVDLMLTRAAEARVSIASLYNATTDIVWADASAIRQVLINLLINAFQALEMQEGDRRVEIRTRSSPSGSVILEVSDNGPGIPVDQRARLFHPFASTKTKGMGLGLAVCADILHEHKATIIVPELERPGATFRITFPCPPPSS